MTNLNTTDDLLRAARENREFREAFRREILTEELINLPQRFENFESETTKNINALTSSVAENSKNIDALTSSVAELTKNVGQMNRNLNEKIDGVNRELGEKIDRVGTSHSVEHNALHRFRGNYAIETTRNNDSNIADLFATLRGIKRFRLKTLTREECDDFLDDNDDAIDLLATEGNIWKTFPKGDVIADVRYRKSGDTIFYIAVEASYTVNADDVIRASDHAKILRAVTGREAFAIVSGVEVNSRIGEAYRQRIIPDLTEYLESEQDDVVFWFQLADRSLEPSPPC